MRHLCRASVFLSLAFHATAATADPPTLRLPDSVKPVKYSADLTLVPEADTFSGVIDIDVDLMTPTDVIWLNATRITVSEATARTGSEVVPATIREGGKDFIGLAFPKPVQSGKARLHLTYKGELNKRNSGGVFKVREGDAWYIYTQFEPIDARQAFPCFDEPQHKTPWQLTLRVKKEHSAVANTPQVSESALPNGMKAVRFAPSQPLPSYLVAIAVGPFDFVDAGKAGKKSTPVRIITPRGKAAQAKYAAEVTGPILNKLEEYFGIPYPYEKLDSIAIPLTFGFGAMENAGLITYASNIILADPDRDSINRQRGYFDTAAHELAHQWFGDLVTMEYWNDIWLNEGFATWMASKIVNEMKPEWKQDIARQNAHLGAMAQDSLVSARKIRQPIESNNDIASAFDGITYQKGAATLGMFESWVGAENFRRGIQRYLRQYAWRNATSGAFLDSIGSISKQGVTKAFSTFLEQSGVPLVTVDLKCDKQATLVLSQQRSLPLGSEGSADQAWEIPVCVRYASDGSVHRDCLLLTSRTMEWGLPNAKSCPAWVQANAEGSGYYRVRYQGGLLQRLLADGGKNLSPEERVSALGNVSALMNAGQIKASDALALVPQFANDPERQVVGATVQIATSVSLHLVPGDLQPNYKRFVTKVYGERARNLGWTPPSGEEADLSLLRAQLVPLVAMRGDAPELTAEARKLADRWLVDRKSVDPNLVNGALGTAAEFGDRDLFDRLAGALKSTQDRRERGQILNVMGGFSDPAIVVHSLNLLLTPEFDLRESAGILFGPANGSLEIRTLPFEFLRQNFEALVGRMPTGSSFDFGAALPYVASGFCDASGLEQVEKFFTPRIGRFSGGPRALAQRLESIRLCIARKSAQEASVAEFLRLY